MSIQRIINGSTELTIQRPTMTSQQISRSGRMVSQSVAFARPWRFAVSYKPGQRYTDARGIAEYLDFLDRRFSEDVDIGDTNPNLSYITGYQGDYLSDAQAATVVNVNSYSDTITINLSSGNAGGGYLFKAGDFVHPGKTQGYPYPYTVVNDVNMPTSAGNVDIKLHRQFIPHDYPNTTTFLNQTMAIGPDVRFRVQLVTKPDHQVVADQLFNTSGLYVFQEVFE